jgi:hypothetical protein
LDSCKGWLLYGNFRNGLAMGVFTYNSEADLLTALNAGLTITYIVAKGGKYVVVGTE